MITQQEGDGEIVARETIPSSDVTRVRFSEIDGLRALAIVAAVIYEATRLAAPSAGWSPVLARVFADASQGLPLFFLLSGFVLAYPALATLREDGRTYLDIGRYIVKRILRVYPAYAVVLGLAFVIPPLALQYGLPALANGTTGLGGDLFARNLFFLGDGLGNDGFRALALEARWYLLFPFVLLLWTRSPRAFFGLMAVAAGSDLLFSGAHAWAAGALVPFMLGIVAADVRAGHHRFERFAFATAGAAAVAAIVLERFLVALPGPLGAPGALRIDPLWSVALFALLVGAGTSGLVERVLSLRVFRYVGAASYGTALVVVPVATFVVRQVVLSFGPGAGAANAAVFSFLGGIVIWQLADRWFADGTLRRDVAEVAGPWVNAALHIVRIDRLTLGAEPHIEYDLDDERVVDAEFYAPPPRSNGALASVSQRTGSPEDLAAEILETKKRLSDRSSVIFAEAEPQPEPEPEAQPEPVLKPGFYRRPPAAKAPAPEPAIAAAAPRPAPVAARAPAAAAQLLPPAPPAHVPPPAAERRPEPVYHEPAPISLSFEAPPYNHYSLEPLPADAPAAAQAVPPPQARPQAPQPQTQPVMRTVPQVPVTPPVPVAGAAKTRGPIKMRIGALGPQAPNGNGTRQTADKT